MHRSGFIVRAAWLVLAGCSSSEAEDAPSNAGRGSSSGGVPATGGTPSSSGKGPAAGASFTGGAGASGAGTPGGGGGPSSGGGAGSSGAGASFAGASGTGARAGNSSGGAPVAADVPPVPPPPPFALPALPATGGASAGAGGSSGGSSAAYPCDGTTDGYDAIATKSGSTWTVVNGGREVYSGADMQQALTRAYSSLTSGRTTKQRILVQGSGDIPATVQLAIPSYTVLNVCGTINVTGTPSGSDRSPLYARNARQIEIPNLKMTGSPQYGIFLRQTDDIHLGHVDLRLSSSAGIGIRIDAGPNASTSTTFNQNLTIDYVYGSGMGSHVVETYGISNIEIGTVEGNEVGECGLLLNRSIHAEVGLVSCTNCATGTGYAAFRVANSVGKVGDAFPAGNIHVKKVYARGGGRGIFSVSGSGGLTIDQIDIADTGNTAILLQNCYNTTIAEEAGSISSGLVQLSNDTDNTNEGVYPPSQNVALKNLTLKNGASVRQDWCAQYGKNGCSATNITGGTVSMCP